MNFILHSTPILGNRVSTTQMYKGPVKEKRGAKNYTSEIDITHLELESFNI